MTLKESYRYANYLDNLLNTAYAYLKNKGFVTTTTQTHLRSKVNSEASDEIVNVQKPYDVDFKPMDVVNFAVKVLDEKEKLVNAIAVAKATAELNIDNAVSMNKKKQAFVSVLNTMANIKASESIVSGSGYKFNQEGNQVKYLYDVKQTTTIDYDRNNIRNLAKKYLKETDAVSSKLDAIEINTVLDFDPKFDVNETFEELVG